MENNKKINYNQENFSSNSPKLKNNLDFYVNTTIKNFHILNSPNKNKNKILDVINIQEKNKFDMNNIIPKSSVLKIDEKKFLSGELIRNAKINKENYAYSTMKNKLTPFQKNENFKSFLKDRIKKNQDYNGEKDILMKKSYENIKFYNSDALNYNNGTCTILNFKSKRFLKEILLTKSKNDNSIIDFTKTNKEIVQSRNFKTMSQINLSKFFIK